MEAEIYLALTCDGQVSTRKGVRAAEVPSWYLLLLAADRIGPAQPWKLVPRGHPLSKPAAWFRLALTARTAEAKASRTNSKKESGQLADLAKKGHQGRVGRDKPLYKYQGGNSEEV